MTIVVAFRDPSTGEVWIGSDTASNSGGYRFQCVERKLIRLGQWWIGVSGTSRGVEVIEEGLAAKSVATERSPGFVREIVDEIFSIFARRGFQPADDHKTGPPCYHHQIIIAGPGEVFDIGEDGSIAKPSWGFVACGSGAPWAEGAAWALVQQKQHSAEDIVALSLRAALQFRSDCGGDLVIEKVG